MCLEFRALSVFGDEVVVLDLPAIECLFQSEKLIRLEVARLVAMLLDTVTRVNIDSLLLGFGCRRRNKLIEWIPHDLMTVLLDTV